MYKRQILLLLERDAFLNRPSVQLSEELKGRARVAPLDSKALFAGQLAELAQKATQDVQSNAWLFGQNKSKLDSPKNVSRSKQSAKKGKAGGKSQTKTQKVRSQPYNNRYKGKKPFTASTSSGPAQGGQRS